MRCLALADDVAKRGMRVEFICREEPGNIINFIENCGYDVHRLSRGIGTQTDRILSQRYLEEHSQLINWLVVDHYDLDARWESHMRQLVQKIMVIDDMANRPHECDLLLNQNYGFSEGQYENLTPSHCIQL